MTFLLYACTGFSKLNDDFFDTKVSCASQTTSMVVTQFAKPAIAAANEQFSLGISEEALNTLDQWLWRDLVVKYSPHG